MVGGALVAGIQYSELRFTKEFATYDQINEW